MNEQAATIAIVAYLLLTLAVGFFAGRRGSGSVTDFVAGERAFGPVVLYFVMGATIFSAYALLGTPQRVVAKGSDAFYILAYGAVGFVPVFYFGAKVRRIGARYGFVTQAELLAYRFGSTKMALMMGVATCAAFIPYLVIQLKVAGLVIHAVMGWPSSVGAAVVYSVVMVYVIMGGVRGVGWTNVIQGVMMLAIVWGLGIWIPTQLYGGVTQLFDRVIAQAPDYLTLPGPGPTSSGQWSSEILVSILGFSMWPQIFMKCFTARSARVVQLSAVLYPTFLLLLLPLLFLGYVAVLEGGPSDDTVLFWLVNHPSLGGNTWVFALVAVAVLAASMSTGDALLHAGAAIFVRDVVIGGCRRKLDGVAQKRLMRVTVVVLGIVAFVVFQTAGTTSVVDLLLLAYAIPIQFLPLTLAGLYWRGAHRVGAELGLAGGLTTVVVLFVADHLAPGFYARLNPGDVQIGVIGGAVNLVLLGLGSQWGRRRSGDAFLTVGE